MERARRKRRRKRKPRNEKSTGGLRLEHYNFDGEANYVRRTAPSKGLPRRLAERRRLNAQVAQ